MKGKRTQNIAALILAAGFSSRMGAFKPLLPFGESSVIETVVNTFRQAGVADIRVVVGWQAERLRPVLDQLQVTVV
ncbi:MAG: metal dependent phosphohydrolase, partial [Sporomusa sp.]|nr:metal dependent phosphohydrolase [Sporomusa sp.]